MLSSPGLGAGSAGVSHTQHAAPTNSLSEFASILLSVSPQLSTETTITPEDSEDHFISPLPRPYAMAISELFIMETHNQLQVPSDYREGQGRAEVFFSAQ